MRRKPASPRQRLAALAVELAGVALFVFAISRWSGPWAILVAALLCIAAAQFWGELL